MIQIEIPDDFDLAKTASCGQCFRAKPLGGGLFRFVSGGHVIYIQGTEKHKFSVSCSRDERENIRTRYFDLDRSYNKLFSTI